MLWLKTCFILDFVTLISFKYNVVPLVHFEYSTTFGQIDFRTKFLSPVHFLRTSNLLQMIFFVLRVPLRLWAIFLHLLTNLNFFKHFLLGGVSCVLIIGYFDVEKQNLKFSDLIVSFQKYRYQIVSYAFNIGSLAITVSFFRVELD